MNREKFELWLENNRDNIDHWAVMTLIFTVIYGMCWSLNWLVTTFLGFTYLWVVVVAWIAFCAGRVGQILWDEHHE